VWSSSYSGASARSGPRSPVWALDGLRGETSHNI
jgi:hypothetical protein